ncbi:MAG TPA: xanthine dehydrogenase family protein molybdopterin-binding subunit [Xanthobacteraceae bacterium]|nr:xanthine dehydrogenase family protein molybdopterin-binding subunit [Xanthobacteraceae bacterium]
MQAKKFGVGQSVTRKEDDPLLRGAGRYVADAAPAGTLHAVVLRSPHAHARVRIDAGKARTMAGVRLVLTGAETAGLGPLPCPVELPGAALEVPFYPILAREEARHVGDAVAFVVADTLAQAKDAAEAIAVAWEELPHVIGAAAAVKPSAPLVWPQRRGNIAFDVTLGDAAATARAFADAAKIVSLTLVNQRLVTNYLDTRGVVAECDDAQGHLTLTLSSQGPHAIRDVLAEILHVPAEELRVVTPDVGGGFGTKLFPYREYALAAFAAKRLRQPVTWIAERSEHFLGDAQGRDNLTTARLALDGRHRFLALEIDLLADMGAYLSQYAPYIPYLGASMSPGLYDIASCHVRVRGVYTNTVPVDAYRGAGRPEAAYVIERLVDAAARETGIAPDELRRRNFIKPAAMPYQTATGKNYDSGDFAAHLSRAKEIADWDGFRARLARSKKASRLRGIGLATYIEACGSMGPQTVTVELERDGSVTVLIGTQSTGQGHATAYAQLVAEHLDLPPERVTVVQGDTARVASGLGTGGSSSIPCGGASLDGAARKLADNLKALASEALEAGVDDLEIAGGAVRVAGTDRAISFAALAQRPDAREHLTAADAFTPPQPTYPNGTHVAEVEIDPATGATDIVNYVVVDDFGATLNPRLLAGQVHGGTVQGIGQALMEETVYDADSGQLVTASLLDYAVPRADQVPAIAFATHNVRCRHNPLGVKGAGEAGAIGSTPAVMNAIVDALWRALRISHLDMPATPERVWRAIEEARRLHRL